MQRLTLMIETAKLDRLLTQVNCRITSIARVRDAGALLWRAPTTGIPKACRARARACSRLAESLPDDRSRQMFTALAKTWLELATDLDLSEALLHACSTVSEHKVEQELRQAIEFRARLMRQIDCQKFAF
jgi:hypothetical protein